STPLGELRNFAVVKVVVPCGHSADRQAIAKDHEVAWNRRDARSGKDDSGKIQRIACGKLDFHTGGRSRMLLDGPKRLNGFRQRKLLADKARDEPPSTHFPLQFQSPIDDQEIPPRLDKDFARQKVAK